MGSPSVTNVAPTASYYHPASLPPISSAAYAPQIDTSASAVGRWPSIREENYRPSESSQTPVANAPHSHIGVPSSRHYISQEPSQVRPDPPDPARRFSPTALNYFPPPSQDVASPVQNDLPSQERAPLKSKPLPPPPPKPRGDFAGDEYAAREIRASALGGRGGPSDWEHFGATAEDESVDDTEIPGLKVIERRTPTNKDRVRAPPPPDEPTSKIVETDTTANRVETPLTEGHLHRNESTSSSYRKTTSSPSHSRYVPTPPPTGEQPHSSPGRTESIVSFEESQHRKSRSTTDRVSLTSNRNPDDLPRTGNSKSTEAVITRKPLVESPAVLSDGSVQAPSVVTSPLRLETLNTGSMADRQPPSEQDSKDAGYFSIVEALPVTAVVGSFGGGPWSEPRKQEGVLEGAETRGLLAEKEPNPMTIDPSPHPTPILPKDSFEAPSSDAATRDAGAPSSGDDESRGAPQPASDQQSDDGFPSVAEQAPHNDLAITHQTPDPYPELHPWFKNSLIRFAEMLHEEGRAETDEERKKIFITCVKREFHFRHLQYGSEPEIVPEHEPSPERAQEDHVLREKFSNLERTVTKQAGSASPNIADILSKPSMPSLDFNSAPRSPKNSGAANFIVTAVEIQAEPIISIDQPIAAIEVRSKTELSPERAPSGGLDIAPSAEVVRKAEFSIDSSEANVEEPNEASVSARKGSDPGPGRPAYMAFRPNSDTVLARSGATTPAYKPYNASSSGKSPFNYRRQTYTPTGMDGSSSRGDYKTLIGRPASIHGNLLTGARDGVESPGTDSSTSRSPARRRAATIKEEHAETFLEADEDVSVEQATMATNVTGLPERVSVPARGRPRAATAVKAEHAETFLEKWEQSVPSVTVTKAHPEDHAKDTKGPMIKALSVMTVDQRKMKELLDKLRTSLPRTDGGDRHTAPDLVAVQDAATESTTAFDFITDLLTEWEIKIHERRVQQEKDRESRARHSRTDLKESSQSDDPDGLDPITFKQHTATEEGEYNSYVVEVFDPTYARLQEEIRAMMNHIYYCAHLMSNSGAGKEGVERQTEQPDPCELIELCLALHAKMEIHQERVFRAISDRDKRYKNSRIQPLFALNDMAELERLDQHFSQSEKTSMLNHCRAREQRARAFKAPLEENIYARLRDDRAYMADLGQIIQQLRPLFPNEVTPSLPTTDLTNLETALHTTHTLLKSLTKTATSLTRAHATATLRCLDAESEIQIADARLTLPRPQLSSALTKISDERRRRADRVAAQSEQRVGILERDLKAGVEGVEGILGMLGRAGGDLEGKVHGLEGQGRGGEGVRSEVLAGALERAKRRNEDIGTG